MDLEFKTIEVPQFPRTQTLAGSGEEVIVVSKADGKTYGIKTSDFKAFLGTVQSVTPRPIKPTDPAPALDGVYIPTVTQNEAGTPIVYTGAGGLTVNTAEGGEDYGKAPQLIRNGSEWVKSSYPLPIQEANGAVENGNTDAVSGGEVFNKSLTKLSYNNKMIPVIGESLDVTMETGSIFSDTGEDNNIGGVPRLRSIGLISVNAVNSFVKDGYEYALFLYNKEGDYLNKVPTTMGAWMTGSYHASHEGLVRILIRKPDNSAIDINEDTGLRIGSFYNKIDNIARSSSLDTSFTYFTRGSISSTDGELVNATNRLRSQVYLRVKNGFRFKVENNIYEALVILYDTDKEFIGQAVAGTWFNDFSFDFDGYIKVIIRRKDNGTILVGDDYQFTIDSGAIQYTDRKVTDRSISAPNPHFIRPNFDVVAHRGVYIDGAAPENSTHSVAIAKRYGFKAVECDVQRTSDGELVIMHDASINRTMRNATDYSAISETVNVASTTFANLRDNYVLSSLVVKYRTPIPTLEEFLESCRMNDIFPLLHTTIQEAFDVAQDILGDNWCAFSSNVDILKYARSISDCLVLYSNNAAGVTAESVKSILDDIGGWCGFSTTNNSVITRSFSRELRAQGWEIQRSIPDSPQGVLATGEGSTILLSDSAINIVNNFEEYNADNDFEDFQTTGIVEDGILNLNNGQTLIKIATSQIKYGGIDITIEYSGSLVIEAGASYGVVMANLNSPITKTDRATLRFHNATPNVMVKANEDSRIYDISLKIGDF